MSLASVRTANRFMQTGSAVRERVVSSKGGGG
jgi:hypothetical protein